MREFAGWTDRPPTIIDHAEPLDIDIYARPEYYFGYHNPKFDGLVAEAERTVDPGQRGKLYGDAERIIADDVPALYLFDLPRLNVWNAKLHGLWADEPIPQLIVRDASWEP